MSDSKISNSNYDNEVSSHASFIKKYYKLSKTVYSSGILFTRFVYYIFNNIMN